MFLETIAVLIALAFWTARSVRTTDFSQEQWQSRLLAGTDNFI